MDSIWRFGEWQTSARTQSAEVAGQSFEKLEARYVRMKRTRAGWKDFDHND